MCRVRPMPILIAITLLAGLQQTAQAGMVLYQQCVTSRGNMSDGFKATLGAGGLFYSWAGYSVKEPVGAGCLPNTPGVPDMFKGKNAAGTNSITEPLAKNIAVDGHLLFYSIRNDTALDEDPAKTTLTLMGGAIGTKIGAALTSAKNDPVIDIFNGGSSTITLLSMVAQLNNSMDPLNPDIFFVPDGSPIFITPTLLPSNMNILPGETAEFEFPLNGSPNWSFMYSYDYLGDTYTDLLASDVPEPSTWLLLGFGLACLAAWRKHA
jgi:hypothetical protein